jgi:hypothetical protein
VALSNNFKKVAISTEPFPVNPHRSFATPRYASFMAEAERLSRQTTIIAIHQSSKRTQCRIDNRPLAIPSGDSRLDIGRLDTTPRGISLLGSTQ